MDHGLMEYRKEQKRESQKTNMTKGIDEARRSDKK